MPPVSSCYKMHLPIKIVYAWFIYNAVQFFFVIVSFTYRISSHYNFTTNPYKLNTLQVLLLSLITVYKKRNKCFK